VDRTKDLLRQEWEIQRNELLESLFFASLERIFIEERIHKDKGFEQSADMDAVVAHIDSRLKPYKKNFVREVKREDILRLLEIKMERILKFNSDKADNRIATLNERIAAIDDKLAHLVENTIKWFEMLKEKYGAMYPRRTIIRNFDTIVASKVAEANEKLYINREDGFIGTSLKKDEFVTNCSDMDDIIIFYKNGTYKVVHVAEKLYVGKNILYLNIFKRNDLRTIYNVVYQDGKGGVVYMKRFAVTGVTRDKEYDFTQGTPGSKVWWFSANQNGEAEVLKVTLKPKFRLKVLQFEVDFADLAIKGKQSRGNIVTKNEVHRITLKERGVSTLGGREVWFDPDVLRLNYDGRGDSLGEFNTNDLVLVVYKNGDFCTTSFDVENHYDDGILRIEKFSENTVWTAVLYDADQGYWYMKRFKFEPSSKMQSFIGGNKDSRLLILSSERYPRVEVKFGGGDSFRESLVLDAEEFIGEKSFKAKGKRLSNFEVDSIIELEPREVEEEEEEVAMSVVDGQNETPDDEHVKSQRDIFDDLTGQRRLFDEE
jgi:topoisomerase-4 subunit A